MFNGSETPGANTRSIAIARATGGGLNPAPMVFTIDFATAPTAVVQICAANQDVAADYQVLYTSTNTQHDYYSDQGIFEFYTVNLSTYSAGGMPTVIVQR